MPSGFAALEDREDLEEWLADILTDSLDADWTGRTGARAIIARVEERIAVEDFIAAINGEF